MKARDARKITDSIQQHNQATRQLKAEGALTEIFRLIDAAAHRGEHVLEVPTYCLGYLNELEGLLKGFGYKMMPTNDIYGFTKRISW